MNIATHCKTCKEYIIWLYWSNLLHPNIKVSDFCTVVHKDELTRGNAEPHSRSLLNVSFKTVLLLFFDNENKLVGVHANGSTKKSIYTWASLQMANKHGKTIGPVG